MRIFWAEGYEAASIDRLCRETRMPRASLYQAYGGKEGLFLAAVAHYVATRIAPLATALGPSGSLRQDLTAFFDEVISLATCDPATPGCLISCVLADAAGTNATFRSELDKSFTALEARIEARLHADTWSDATTDMRSAARMLAAIARGIMLRARSGAGKDELAPIAAAGIESVMRLRA
ncbi:TetR/AcrR family transcriptional regulator [Paracoccus methylarcula]|nr:TetR/AcrR family transcriptional regulator [Paracoccus methylarcula]